MAHAAYVTVAATVESCQPRQQGREWAPNAGSQTTSITGKHNDFIFNSTGQAVGLAASLLMRDLRLSTAVPHCLALLHSAVS